MGFKTGSSLAVLVALIAVLVFPAPADAGQIKADFVFMIDSTGSMGGEIAGVKNGLASFVNGLDTAQVDARFAIVLFGGISEVVLDFTNVLTVVDNAFTQITIGANEPFQRNHDLNPEAGLESIRQVLGAAPIKLDWSTALGGGQADLVFRNDARKNLILVTDEDADAPSRSANRIGTGQNQGEVDATAAAVIAHKAFINMLISHDANSEWQYGDYVHDVSDADFKNFNAAATLANLLGDTATDQSLEAQVLGAGLIARAFNVFDADDQDFIDNFFAAKIEETTTNTLNGVPLPGAAWMGLGLLGGLGVIRRIRRR